MEMHVCKLCKEPIANFACLECLGKSISEWLPSPTKETFEKENKGFLDTFGHSHTRGTRHGLFCSNEGSNICIYFYVNEVYQWLLASDKPVARRFRNLFAFGMRKVDFREIIISHAEPITESGGEKARTFGVCDVCGEYSEELSEKNGEFICGGCENG